MTLDNYLYVYYIDLDAAKTISSITLPNAPGIKIAAISAVNSPIPGFGSINGSERPEIDYVPIATNVDEFFWNLSALDFSIGARVGTLVSTGATDRQNIHVEGEIQYTGLTITYFPTFISAGAVGNSGEGPQNIIANSTAKFCGGVSADTAWFVVDAGQARKMPCYNIRGANDDTSYNDRVLDSWIIQGSASSSGPWTTVSTVSGMGTGWTSNNMNRAFMFDWSDPDLPEEGYRYYRLQVTAQGLSGVSPSGTMQFSCFALASGTPTYLTTGSLRALVEEGTAKQAGAVTIDTVTGQNIVTFKGEVAKVGTAPITARTYTTIRSSLSINVRPDTKLSYMINPKDSAGAYAAVDVRFSDNTRLRDLATAVDQYGIRMNPQNQGAGGKLIPGQWNYVECELGKYANGKTITAIIIGYDNPSAALGTPVECSFDYILVNRERDSIDLGKFINMQVTNGTSASENVNAYIALYSAAGKMVNLWISDAISIGADSSISIKPEDVVFGLTAAGPKAYAKVFIWTKDGFIPLTNAVYFVC
jgi:hypothetical protein